jgi:hypothetical protein
MQEDADWVGVRDHLHSYGFAMFDVAPVSRPGWSSIDVTFFDTAQSTTGDPTVFERFTLTRPLRHEAREGAAATAAGNR